MRTKTPPQKNAEAELQVGKAYVTKDGVNAELGTGRALASLSAARMLQSGRYWISSKNVPKSNGYYRDNKDGTFTKVANRTDVDCQDRLHVSAQAAAKVAADEECPLLLIVRGVGFESDSRLDVVLIEWTDDDARVAYVSIA